jgi:RNA polymerase sigma-70 factor (ECF subfamily)
MSVPLADEDAASRYAERLDRARRQDRDAFAQLYEATYRHLFVYILARTGERSAAEDLLQDVYLAALQAIGRFRGRTQGEFLGWLLKIAQGKMADRLRSRYRHPEVAIADALPGDTADPIDAVDERLRLREIAEALGQLTDEQREVVVNRLVLGFDLEETSRIVRKNVGSVKALQHRGLARLARILLKGGADHA